MGVVLIQEREISPIHLHSASEGRSLSDRVYDYLSEQIITGAIAYGDRLNIKHIAAQLNVSTIPIRDAMKRLEQEHVIRIHPRSHCTVRIPTKKGILDAIDSRRMVELFALRSVYGTVTSDQLGRLKSIVADMDRIARDPESQDIPSRVARYIELDRQFHTEICNLPQNDYLRRFYREINMHLSMSFSYGIGVCHGIESTFKEHKEILRLLEEHSRQAITVLEQHLLHSRKNIIGEARFQSLPPEE